MFGCLSWSEVLHPDTGVTGRSIRTDRIADVGFLVQIKTQKLAFLSDKKCCVVVSISVWVPELLLAAR